MKAMILAAGRGERMRPLTDTTPKPLLKVGKLSLIEHHILNLKQHGFNELVINTAWLAEKIHQQLGDGAHYGVAITYSDEHEALETAGGIKNALHLLGSDPFLALNADIWCPFPFDTLPELASDKLAHLVLVDNPAHNTGGDFGIHNGLLSNEKTLTFSGIGIYRPELFTFEEKRYPLAPLLRAAAEQQKITAEHFLGEWIDIGTPERLQQLSASLA